MIYRNYAFSARISSESCEDKSGDRAARPGRFISGDIPRKTAEYVNAISFSREEMNEAYARARAQGKRVNV